MAVFAFQIGTTLLAAAGVLYNLWHICTLEDKKPRGFYTSGPYLRPLLGAGYLN